MTRFIRSTLAIVLLLGLGEFSTTRASYLPRIHASQWTLGVNVQNGKVGTQITGVANGSPAQKVGLERGDIILAVSGNPIGLVGGRLFTLDNVLNASVNARGQVVLSVQDGRTGQVGLVPVQLSPVNIGFQPPAQRPGLQLKVDQQIRGWYLMYLGRVPRAEEVRAWVNQVALGKALGVVQVEILASAEYYLRFNNNPTLFVQSIYQPILGRELTRNEVGVLVQRLAINFRGDRTLFIQNALAGN